MGLDLFEAVGCLSRSSKAIIYKDNEHSVTIERAVIQEIYSEKYVPVPYEY